MMLRKWEAIPDFMRTPEVRQYWDILRKKRFQLFLKRFFDLLIALIMLILLKAFDIGFFDWVLLCNAGFDFFPRFYPECKPVLGHYLFGYNWKTHLAHVIAFFPISVLIAWICTLF